MSRTDILEEIKKTETDAKSKVEQAETDKKAAIANARRSSVQKIQDAEAQIRSNYESSIAKEQKKLDVDRDKILAVGTETASQIDKNVESKMKTVKDFLNKEFVRALNVNA